MIWHSTDAEKVITELGSDREQGLSSAEVFKRLELYGKNEIHDFEKPRFWKILLKRFIGYKNIILTLLAVIYLIISAVSRDVNWAESAVLISILILSNLAGATLSFRNIKKVDSLRNSHTSY